MKKYISTVIAAIILICGIVLGIMSGFSVSVLQKETLQLLLIICGCSVCYCFVVGEITRNTSQMDKLWSILPVVYSWVIAAKGGFSVRLIVFAVVATIWGVRLTVNFARKGAYSIRFWEGVEDYRWAILRSKKPFSNKIVWAIFDLFFISFYQNALVLGITLPAVVCMESDVAFGVIDVIATIFAVAFLVYELVADEYQWKFHQTKKKLLAEGKTLEELPAPYNKGFNTTGPWGFSRHPNYLGEQGVWMSLYFMSVGAGIASYGIFNWSIIFGLLLILLFLGSSTLAENISIKKYPEYAKYQASVFKYLPIRKYK